MSTSAWKPDYTPISTVDARTAELVKDAFMYLVGDEDTPEQDCLFDVVHTLYSHVFPGASRVLTPEESAEHNRKLAAEEPPPASYFEGMAVAGKVLTYLEHIDAVMEQSLDRVLEPGKYQGAFVLDFDTRQCINYLLADVTSELLKLPPFQEAKKVQNAMYVQAFRGGEV